MHRLFLFCLLFIASTYSYQLNDDENDIELTEEDVENLLKAHMMRQSSDPLSNEELITSDEENMDENFEGRELTEDHIRELLHRYMSSEQEKEDGDDDEDNNDNEIERMLEKVAGEEVSSQDENEPTEIESADQVELLNEISDGSFEDEEFDMSSLKSKDPKALWGRFRVRFPRIRLPRIRLPRIRLPRIRIRFPRIRFPRIRLPRIRLPRIRLRRIRWPRVRFPRIRLRFILPRKPSQPNQPNPCPYNANQIVNSINGIRCDNHWKKIFDYPAINALIDNNEFFTTACKQLTVCLGCMNTNPWNKGQCTNKLKRSLKSFCEGLADGDDGTLQWCNDKVNKIVDYENKKANPPQLYYCKCGDDVTDIGKP